MQQKYLRRLIIANAAFITSLHDDIAEIVNDAKYYKGIGEIAFATAHYKLADKTRAKLAKAVETQKALKAEMEAQHNVQRITSVVNKLKAAGVNPLEALVIATDNTKTLGEKLNGLRAML